MYVQTKWLLTLSVTESKIGTSNTFSWCSCEVVFYYACVIVSCMKDWDFLNYEICEHKQYYKVQRMTKQFTTVILQSLWVHKYNSYRQHVLVILQSLWVYKYNRQDVLVILQSLWVHKYNGSFYSHYGYTNTIDKMY